MKKVSLEITEEFANKIGLIVKTYKTKTLLRVRIGKYYFELSKKL